MTKIEVVVKKYFAGIGYDGYSTKFSDGGTINFRISKGVIKEPKPDEIRVTLEWNDFKEA